MNNKILWGEKKKTCIFALYNESTYVQQMVNGNVTEKLTTQEGTFLLLCPFMSPINYKMATVVSDITQDCLLQKESFLFPCLFKSPQNLAPHAHTAALKLKPMSLHQNCSCLSSWIPTIDHIKKTGKTTKLSLNFLTPSLVQCSGRRRWTSSGEALSSSANMF